MIKYGFLLLFLIIVFSNLYFNYYKQTENFFFNNKKKKKKKKQAQAAAAAAAAAENAVLDLISNTNNFMRQGVLREKLKEFDVSQLESYLTHLTNEEPKYVMALKKDNLLKNLSNNEIYSNNILSKFLKEKISWKYE